MAKKRLTPQDRMALEGWNELVASIRESSDINPADSTAEIEARKKRLEADDEAWFRYYFAQYYTCNPADFHKRATRRMMAHERWYEVRAWSRELAKSARAMMEIIKLALTRRVRNVLLISNSQDNAQRLLLPFMANLEENQRIIQDYGTQKKPGAWETGEFTCQSGCSFRAIGAGQSPRGTRNKNFRPDCILIDDIDTDEECRNPERIKAKWKWLEEALIPTMSVSGHYRVLFNGNIIAADCCITRAIEKAEELKAKGIGHVDIINIRGEKRRILMARKELGRGHRPVPIPGQRVRRAEGVFQQPGGRRRGVPGNSLRESTHPYEVQIPGHLRRPRAGREQKQKEFYQDNLPPGENKRTLIHYQNIPRPGIERGVHPVVRASAGLRRRTMPRVLLHGEQQIARPLLPAGVPATGQKGAPRAGRGTLHQRRRGQENGQGHPHRSQPRTAQPGREPHF